MKHIVTIVLLAAFICTGFLDALLHNKLSYSSIMAMDINRVYFYSLLLLTLGSWMLYHRWLVGVGFLALASFNAYFVELLFLHNYFASILVYFGMLADIIVRKKYTWLLPFILFGIIQSVAFTTGFPSRVLVICMEFASLVTGTVFVARTMGSGQRKIKIKRRGYGKSDK